MLFRGNYYFLSNMFLCPIEYKGYVFKCSESAFQASKSVKKYRDAVYEEFQSYNGFAAKAAGYTLQLRPMWNYLRVDVMYDILCVKFEHGNYFYNELQKIRGYIEETNTWGDTYWGVCNGVGHNVLGNLLMRVRDET